MAAERTKVTIMSQKHKIDGFIDLIPGARLTDYMNNSNRFIAVTDARVFDHENNQILEAKFLDILVDNIEIIFPSEGTV
ncbi:MAG: hypothetical protein HKP41_03145 [Desulfobacterales bacterium]|nr:hypothetical protein [Desulfofustis sp.]MBT8360949.1 hypothetical protein [Deltaproteobacteria bacterium]NNK93326.1 hypothetical protein [Desulfobacterales bacterium]